MLGAAPLPCHIFPAIAFLLAYAIGNRERSDEGIDARITNGPAATVGLLRRAACPCRPARPLCVRRPLRSLPRRSPALLLLPARRLGTGRGRHERHLRPRPCQPGPVSTGRA